MDDAFQGLDQGSWSELAGNTRLFHQLLEKLPAAAYLCDTVGRITYFNTRAQRLWGRSPKLLDDGDRYCGSYRLFSVAGDAIPHDQCWVAQALQTGEDFHGGEVVIERPDGQQATALAHVSVLRGPQRQIIGMLNVLVDITERKQSEERLRSSDERYSRLVNDLDGIVWEVDARTLQFRFVSQQAERILGYPVSRWLDEPKFWSDHIHPDDRDWAIQFCQSRSKQGLDHSFEYRMLAADGREVWLHDLVSVEMANGCPVTLRGVMVEITELKRAEEALRASQAHLVASQRIARVGSWELDLNCLHDLDSNPLRWSEEAYRVFGYDPASVVSTNQAFWHRVHPDDRPLVQQAVRQAIDTQSVYEIEHRVVLDDGAERIIHERAVLTIDPKSGKPAKFIGTSQDVTERRQAEQAVRRSEALLRQFAENIPQVVWMTGTDLRQVEYVSPSYERVFGRSPAEVYKSPHAWLNAVHEDDRARIHDALLEMEQGRGFDAEYRVVLPDGAIRWMFDRGVPIRDEQGRIDRYVGIADDITDRKLHEEEQTRHQAELLHASRLSTVGQMVASLSHEVAQPLSAIGNFAAACAAILESSSPKMLTAPQWAELKEYTSAIVKQNDRCRSILQRLRDFSGGAQRLSNCDINEVLCDCVELTAYELRRVGVAVQFELAESLPTLRVDRIQLQQLIVNLLINARDAVRDQPGDRRTVTLHSRADGPSVLLEVEDRGIGLSEEVQRRLFEPFFTTKPNGMGIGLSICRSIVKDHGGVIEAIVNAYGGATFRVWLPVPRDTSHA